MPTDLKPIDRAGTFRARPVFWKLKRFLPASQAVAVTVKFEILSWLNEKNEWFDCDGVYSVWGDYFVIKKNGEINESSAEMLGEHLRWRSFAQIATEAPALDIVVQVRVFEDSFKDQTTYRASWINAENHAPGRAVSLEEVADAGSLDDLYGSQIRAITGGVAKPRPPPKDSKQAAERSLADAIDKGDTKTPF